MAVDVAGSGMLFLNIFIINVNGILVTSVLSYSTIHLYNYVVPQPQI